MTRISKRKSWLTQTTDDEKYTCEPFSQLNFEAWSGVQIAIDLGVGELHNTVSDEGRYYGTHQLTTVHGARRHFGVESHLLVRNVSVAWPLMLYPKALTNISASGCPGKA